MVEVSCIGKIFALLVLQVLALITYTTWNGLFYFGTSFSLPLMLPIASSFLNIILPTLNGLSSNSAFENLISYYCIKSHFFHQI